MTTWKDYRSPLDVKHSHVRRQLARAYRDERREIRGGSVRLHNTLWLAVLAALALLMLFNGCDHEPQSFNTLAPDTTKAATQINNGDEYGLYCGPLSPMKVYGETPEGLRVEIVPRPVHTTPDVIVGTHKP